jgi:hypothetical protein
VFGNSWHVILDGGNAVDGDDDDENEASIVS